MSLFSSLFGAASESPVISGAKARELAAAGAVPVDVRSPGEVAGGSVPGAVNIPVETLPAGAEGKVAKDATVVVFCRSGARSARALSFLKGAGYATVYDMGGVGNW